MRMVQLVVLLVPAVIGGVLASNTWNLSTDSTMFMGLPPALALIGWAVIVSE